MTPSSLRLLLRSYSQKFFFLVRYDILFAYFVVEVKSKTFLIDDTALSKLNSEGYAMNKYWIYLRVWH